MLLNLKEIVSSLKENKDYIGIVEAWGMSANEQLATVERKLLISMTTAAMGIVNHAGGCLGAQNTTSKIHFVG